MTWEYIKKLAKENLDGYPTSLERDQDLLEDLKSMKADEITENQRSCLKLRTHEKLIFDFLYKCGTEISALAQMMPDQAEKKIDSMMKDMADNKIEPNTQEYLVSSHA